MSHDTDLETGDLLLADASTTSSIDASSTRKQKPSAITVLWNQIRTGSPLLLIMALVLFMVLLGNITANVYGVYVYLQAHSINGVWWLHVVLMR